jgi:hypothetical protein
MLRYAYIVCLVMVIVGDVLVCVTNVNYEYLKTECSGEYRNCGQGGR